MTNDDKPLPRALTVLSAVAQYGPVTLTGLVHHLPTIPRVAIWRALQNLNDAGWIRVRLGTKAWIVTARAFQVFENAKTITSDAVDMAIANLPASHKGPISVGTFTVIGRFEIVEATDPDLIGTTLPLIGEPMSLAALAISEEADMLRHLKRWMQTDATPEERALITEGGMIKGLRRARKTPELRRNDGYTRSHRAEDGSVAVAWIAT